VTPANEQIIVTAGQPPPKPENRVTFNFRGADSGTGITQVGSKLRFTRNTIGTSTFDIVVSEGGSYRVTASLRNPTGWTLFQPTAAKPFTIKLAKGSPNPQDFPLVLRPEAGATETDIIFTIERTADGEVFSTTYTQPLSVI
jgi:hypothetical protein